MIDPESERREADESQKFTELGSTWRPENSTGVVREPLSPAEWSRRALIDLVENVLTPHRDALTLVGAHAVMLRTASLRLRPAFTSDGDFGLTPSLVSANSANPSILALMSSAGFERRDASRPGLWGRGRDLDRVGRTVWKEQIDLIVGQGLAGNAKKSSRSVRALGRDRMSASCTEGIELSALDRSEMEIVDLVDPSIRTQINTAGHAALICSKAYKLGERLAAGGRRLRDKDAGDLWRLLECADPEGVGATFSRHLDHDEIGDSVRTGTIHVRTVLRSEPIRTMAARSFGGEVSPRQVSSTFDRWVSEFRCEIG